VDANYKWTIVGTRGGAISPKAEFATKREAVQAMMGRREAKSAINRDGRNYQFTEKK